MAVRSKLVSAAGTARTAASVLPGAAWWAPGLFYLIGGLIWVLPAGLLVTWMVRPRR